MIEELPHTSFGFHIGDISFFFKLYAFKDDSDKILPRVDLKIVQGEKVEESRCYRLIDLRFLDYTSLNAIDALVNYNHTELGEDRGYNNVTLQNIEIDYYLIGEYFLKFIVNPERGEAIEVRIRNEDNPRIQSGISNLGNLKKSIDVINDGIAEFMNTYNFHDKFFDKFSYNGRDKYHRMIGGHG